MRNSILTVIGALMILLSTGCGGGGGGGGSTADTTRPTAAFTANKAMVGSSQVVTFTLAFSEVVTGFDPATDLSASGGTIGSVTQSGGSYSIPVTAVNYASASNVAVSIASGSAADAAGNLNVVTTSSAIPIVPTWTVFMYGHADHNLGDILAADLLEMAAVATGDHVRILVLADWNAGLTANITAANVVAGAAFPTGAHWYRVDDGNANGAGSLEYVGELSAVYGEDFDDTLILTDSTQLAFQAFPSDRRAVILYNHGGGWSGGYGTDSDNGSSSSDDYSMSVESAISSISTGLANAGITSSRPLDILAFETCLLGAVEVADRASGLASVMIGNGDLAWGAAGVHGFFDHTGFLSSLASNPSSDASVIASAEVAAFDTRRAAGTIFMDKQVRAHAAIDLRNWTSFRTAMSTLRGNLEAVDSAALSNVFLNAIPGYGISDAKSHARVPTGDIGTLLTALSSWSNPVGSNAGAARSAFQSALLANSLGTVRSDAGTQVGVSIEMPISKDWFNLDAANPSVVANPIAAAIQSRGVAYVSLASSWASNTEWHKAVNRAASGDDFTGFTISSTITNGTNPTSLAKPLYEFYAPEQDMAHGSINLYLEMNISGIGLVYAQCGLVADQALTPLDPGYVYQFEWDGKLVTIGDGTNSALAALRPYTSGAFYAIDGEFSKGGDTAEGSILVSANTGQAVGVVINTPSPTGLDWSAVEGSTFKPRVTYLSGGTPVTALWPTPLNVSSSGLTVADENAENADFKIEMRLDDSWGNASFDSEAVSVGLPFGDG